jgi:uncharacterized protein (TIGR02594 family)
MSGTARQDVLLVIRAKDEGLRLVDAASDALQSLFEAQADLGNGAKATGSQLLDLLGKIRSVEKAYSGVDAAANRADVAFDRQQRKLAETKAELASVQSQIVGVGRAIAQAQSDIVDAKLGGADTDPFIARLQAAKSALTGLQGQEARLNSSVRAQAAAVGEARSSLQQLGSTANAVEAALAGIGGTAAREMLEARLATEKATEALREQARVARDEVRGRAAQSRINSLLGVREPAAGGAAKQSAAVFDEHLRAAEAIGRAAREVGSAQAAMAAAIGRAAQEVGAAETVMAQKAAALKERLDPLAAIQHRLNKELKDARDLYRSGHISAQELALGERVLAENAKAAADALERQGKGGHGKVGLFGLKPYELTNFGHQANDIVTQLMSGTSLTQTLAQQGGQLIQIFPRVGAAILGALANPAILGSAAVFTLVALSIKKVFDESTRLRTLSGTLTAMGDGARYDAQALSEATTRLDRFGMSAEQALAVVRRFLREGMNPAVIEDFGRAAQNMVDVFGGEVKEAAQQIDEGFSGSYDSIARLDDALNFLKPSEREHIRLLYQSGRASDARAEAAKRFISRMDEAAEKSRGSWTKAGRGLEVMWNGLLETLSKTDGIQKASGFLGSLVGLLGEIGEVPKGAPSEATKAIDKQIDGLKRKLTSTKDMLRNAILSPEGRQALIADMIRIEGQIQALHRRRAAELGRVVDPVSQNSAAEQKRLAGIRAEELASLRVVDLEQKLDEARRRGNAARSAAIAGEIEYQRVLNQTKDAAKAQAARVVAERQENVRSEAQTVQAGQALLRTANRYDGYNENNRPQRAVLMEMSREAGITLDPSKLAWCAAFINAVLAANGLPTAKGAGGGPTTRAADFKSYGSGVALDDARPGDIVVLRPQARGASGHVGLFSGFDESGNVRLTAGNQGGSKKVSTQAFGRDEVIAVRRPGLPDQDAAFLAQADQQRIERQQTFNETLAEEAERRSRSVAQATALLKLSGDAYLAEQRRQAIDNALWNAEQQAKRQALELTKEQRAEIERTAAAEWDALNAREKATRPVEELSRQRDALVESIRAARRAGEDVIGDALEKDLGSVDEALQQAIVSAVEFWSQFDTPEAHEALLGLGNLRDSLRRTIGEMRQAQVDLAQEERQAVLGRIATAREAGDTALSTGLEQRLSAVDGLLEKAIDSAMAFYKQFDSPEARTARTNLAALRDDIAKTQGQLRLDKMNDELGQFQAQRAELQELIAFYRSIGEMDVANDLRSELRALDSELIKVIDHLSRLWSQSTRPEAQATLLNLQNLRNQIVASQNEFRIAAGDIQQAFAGSMVNAVNQWAEAIGQGRNAIRATWDAARQFAADFLRQLAMMLLQALALKAAMKFGFGKVANGMNSLLNAAPLMLAGQTLGSAGDKVVAGGVAIAASAAALMAAASMLLAANASGSASGGAGAGGGGMWASLGGALGSVMHSGGIVGSGGLTRAVQPSWFANATRYHGGGIVGLRPREIPAILERGEEVLTRADPRHILNGGMVSGSAAEPVVNLKNVVVFDPAQVLSQGLSTSVGERSLLTFVRSNAASIRAALQG